MKPTKLASIVLLAIAVPMASQQTPAQLTDLSAGPGYSNFISTLLNNKIWEASMNRYTKNYPENSGASRSRSSGQASPPEVPAYRKYPVVQFKSTGTRLMLQEYLDSVNASPQDKAELKELVLGILSKYETAAAAKGYPNDLALAFVSYIGLNSHVYTGKTGDVIVPFEQNIGLRDVVAEHARDNGIFDGYTDRKKQEIYEFLVIFGGLTYHLYQKAGRENNVEELKNSKLAAAQNLKLLGLKP